MFPAGVRCGVLPGLSRTAGFLPSGSRWPRCYWGGYKFLRKILLQEMISREEPSARCAGAASAEQPSEELRSSEQQQTQGAVTDQGPLTSYQLPLEARHAGNLKAISSPAKESGKDAGEAGVLAETTGAGRSLLCLNGGTNAPSCSSTYHNADALGAEDSRGNLVSSVTVATLPGISRSPLQGIQYRSVDQGGLHRKNWPSAFNESPSTSEGQGESCAKCGAAGAFTCCVACLRSFHITCVTREVRQQDANLQTVWTCPRCKEPVDGRHGQLSAEAISKPGSPKGRPAGHVDRKRDGTDASSPTDQTAAWDGGRNQCNVELGDRARGPCDAGGPRETGEKKEYMAANQHPAESATSPKAFPCSAVRSASPSPSNYGRKRRRGDNGTSTATRCKVSIGPRHQVPALPPFFLDSSCVWDGNADTLVECQSVYRSDDGETARLVYSPYAMQRVYKKRLAEGAEGRTITTAEDMNSFIQRVAENWSSKSGWQPFSPEYAFKLLHFAGYDPHRAIRIMKDPSFSFIAICDPPQRRYDNKWRPKDRRGQIGTNPFPSPLTLRAYLSKRSQYAAAAAASYRCNSTR